MIWRKFIERQTNGLKTRYHNSVYTYYSYSLSAGLKLRFSDNYSLSKTIRVYKTQSLFCEP